MGLDDIMLSEMNPSKMTNIAWFHFYEVSTVIKSMETENIILVAKVCEEEGLENCCSMGIGVQSCKMKIFYRSVVEQRVRS